MAVIRDLQKELKKSAGRLEAMLRDGRISELHREINYIASLVGEKHSLGLSVNFPEQERMEETIRGERNVSLIVDPTRKGFKVPPEEIKKAALRAFRGARIEDFSHGEGFHVVWAGGRISLFPGSMHMWCDAREAEAFLDWLMKEGYF